MRERTVAEAAALNPETIRKAWRDESDSKGRIILREKGSVLALKTSPRSVSIVACLYSRQHGATIQRSLGRFGSPAEITESAMEAIRKKAETLATECRAETSAIDDEAARTLANYRNMRLRELVAEYYQSDHFLTRIKDDAQRQTRRHAIDQFCNFAPSIRGKLKVPFGARRIGVKTISREELDAYKRYMLGRYRGPCTYNRARAYLLKAMRVLAREGKIADSAVFKIDREPENVESHGRLVTLDNATLLALWEATEELPVIHRNFVRLLILSGQRVRQIAELRDEECRFDTDIPHLIWSPKRMKNNKTHLLPVTPRMIALIQETPRYAGNPYVFGGSESTPISGFHFFKKKLVAKMATTLGRPIDFRSFVFHDLRRVFFDKCNAAGVEPHIRERLMAHAVKTLSSSQASYDASNYIREKARAMTLLDGAYMRAVEPGEHAEAEDEKAVMVRKFEGLPLEKQKAILQIMV